MNTGADVPYAEDVDFVNCLFRGGGGVCLVLVVVVWYSFSLEQEQHTEGGERERARVKKQQNFCNEEGIMHSIYG